MECFFFSNSETETDISTENQTVTAKTFLSPDFQKGSTKIKSGVYLPHGLADLRRKARLYYFENHGDIAKMCKCDLDSSQKC